MLRNALRSVSAQTASARISEVVVIENLSNRESEDICREFSQLPIRYVFREPPIPPGFDSAQDALKYINSDYLAILFDDDWWSDQHLEDSIASHGVSPDVVASYGSCLWTTGEEGFLIGVHSSFIPWFASASPKINNRWIFGISDLLVAGLLETSFHFSSLLIKRAVWVQCLTCIRDGNPFDTDRLISVEIGRHGKVAMDTAVHAFIRAHENQESKQIGATTVGQSRWNKSTESLLVVAQEAGVDLRAEFSRRLNEKSVSIAQLTSGVNPASIDSLRAHKILEEASACDNLPRRSFWALSISALALLRRMLCNR